MNLTHFWKIVDLIGKGKIVNLSESVQIHHSYIDPLNPPQLGTSTVFALKFDDQSINKIPVK